MKSNVKSQGKISNVKLPIVCPEKNGQIYISAYFATLLEFHFNGTYFALLSQVCNQTKGFSENEMREIMHAHNVGSAQINWNRI